MACRSPCSRKCTALSYQPWERQLLFLLCNFTIKQPLKISKIEKIDRQAVCQSTLILTNQPSLRTEKLI